MEAVGGSSRGIAGTLAEADGGHLLPCAGMQPLELADYFSTSLFEDGPERR